MIVRPPKTLSGIVLVLSCAALAIVVGGVLVPNLVALGPWMWGGLALVAIAVVAIVIHMRRVEAARERAWVDSFSFGDVVARRRAEELRSKGA
jgi:membrane protein implicated in regulation of membrane protease activity